MIHTSCSARFQLLAMQSSLMERKENRTPFSFNHTSTPPIAPHPPSPRERHQPRIQDNRQQKMTSSNCRQWQDGHKIFDMPIPGHPSVRRQRQEHHSSNSRQRKEHAKLEPLSDFRDLDEEVRGFDFFGGGAPSHVVTEHVGEDGGGDVEGEATEKDGEKEGPFEVEEDYIQHGCSVMAVLGGGQEWY